MKVYLNSEGSIIQTVPSVIGRGSTVTDFEVEAPFSAAILSVRFTLRSGTTAPLVLPRISAVSSPGLNVWSAKIPYAVTEFSGAVPYSIEIQDSDGLIVNTVKGTLTISPGQTPTVPDTPPQDAWTAIKSYLNQILSYSNEAAIESSFNRDWIEKFESALGIVKDDEKYELVLNDLAAKLKELVESKKIIADGSSYHLVENMVLGLLRVWVQMLFNEGLITGGSVQSKELLQLTGGKHIRFTSDEEMEPIGEMLEAYQNGEIGTQGPPGDPGPAGPSGVSPTAKVEQTDSGAVISITDGSGTTTANIANGKDGEAGPQGPQGEQGPAGAQGPKGDTGAQGPKGDTGAQGPKGAEGAPGATGTPGKSAYAYAQDGGYTGTEEEFAEKLAAEMPEKLPNPYSLTINGVEYDGSEAVDIEITGGSGGGSTGESSLLGQTPYTLTKAENVRLVGDGDCTYNIKGVTVADTSSATASGISATFTQNEDYIEFKSTGGSAWYSSHVDLTMGGLTVGEQYYLILDLSGVELDTANHITDGHYILKDASGATIVTAEMAKGTVFHKYEFAATTTTVTLICYPAGNSTFVTGKSISRATAIYLNRVSGGTAKTDIVDQTGSFTDSYLPGALPKGTTIESTPSCYVYRMSDSGGGTGGGSLPLEGKTVVCFGDSLFGMYTGSGSAPAYVAKRTGATVHNVGFGGCRMSVHPYTGYNEFCMYALAEAIAEGDWSAQDAAASKGSANFPDQLAILKEIDFGEVDYIVIHYGTNDFTAGIAMDSASDPKDYNTLCGALRYSVEKLLTAYPKLRIFVSVPAFRYWTAADGSVTYSDTYQNGNGHTLVDFVEALRKTAEEYNLPVIDSYYGLGINKVNASAFLADGVHHNVDGRKRFGEFIGASIVAENTGKGASVAVSDNGGSASIDVTAEAGQTIVVEEVDENGKPTKWRAADYQPRTHWRGSIEVLAETACVVDEEVGAALLPDMEISAGDNLTVVYNGTEYACTCADLGYLSEGMLGLGNYGPMVDPDNPVDTGEPFVVAKLDAGDGTLIWCCIPIDASAAFTLSIIGMGYHAIPQEYLSNSFPYYIDVSGIGTNDDPYTCNERVSDVNAVYESGRSVIVRLRELNQVNGYTVWTFYHLNAKMEMFDKTVTMYTFARPMPTNARQELLYLIAQNDGTFGVTDSFGE